MRANSDDGSFSSRKRPRDDCADRSEAAVVKIRQRMRNDAPMFAAVRLARETIERLLRTVKGAHHEEVVESCGLSLAPETSGTNGTRCFPFAPSQSGIH